MSVIASSPPPAPAHRRTHYTLSTWVSVLLVGALAAIGGWINRWISDDGLIVLRTVRNLMAGNGPTFNAYERVEANTSTLWQYVIWLGAEITGRRLETVALWLALGFTVLGVMVATWATARWYAGWVAPFGALIYLALPPARDFATSGLEWGLSLFYLAVLWALLVKWVRGVHPAWLYLLAFWGGLSWLVRPEFALYGGIVGLALIVVYFRQPARIGLIALSALPVPVGYQIFRMGYYGLLTPHTAVAKSAGEAAWASGWAYVLDLLNPYAGWIMVAVTVAVGLWLFAEAAKQPTPLLDTGQPWLRTRAGVTTLMMVCALIHVLYTMRVGGDFMHGRMLLLPLFALLLPVMVVPVYARTVQWVGVLAVACAVLWASIVVVRGPQWENNEKITELGVVDERGFWTMAAGREPGDPPKNADDYLTTPAMQDFPETLEQVVANNDGQMMQIILSRDPDTFSWIAVPREPGNEAPATVYMINLGMIAMHAPLDVRVLDTVGLATPLAARQPRIPGERIGHDKWLPVEYQLADSPVDIRQLPDFVDAQGVAAARVALQDPEIQELLAAIREPLTWERFVRNIKYSLTGARTLEISEDPFDYLQERDSTSVAGQ